MVPIVEGLVSSIGYEGLKKIHENLKKKNPSDYEKHYIKTFFKTLDYELQNTSDETRKNTLKKSKSIITKDKTKLLLIFNKNKLDDSFLSKVNNDNTFLDAFVDAIIKDFELTKITFVHDILTSTLKYYYVKIFIVTCSDSDSISEILSQVLTNQKISLELIRSFENLKNQFTSILVETNLNTMKNTNKEFSLTELEKQIIIEASKDPNGQILFIPTFGGTKFQTNKTVFNKKQFDAREEAMFDSIIENFEDLGLIKKINYKREIFKLTSKGYKCADDMKQ